MHANICNDDGSNRFAIREPNGAFSITCGANFGPLALRRPEGDRALSGWGKAERLTLLAPAGNGGASVMAVELACDPDDSIDRFEVRHRHCWSLASVDTFDTLG